MTSTQMVKKVKETMREVQAEALPYVGPAQITRKRKKRKKKTLTKFIMSFAVCDSWRPTGQQGIWDSEVRLLTAASLADATLAAAMLTVRDLVGPFTDPTEMNTALMGLDGEKLLNERGLRMGPIKVWPAQELALASPMPPRPSGRR